MRIRGPGVQITLGAPEFLEMKVAVVSDSHGNISGLRILYTYLVEEEGIRRFFHLGHYFHDVERAHLFQIQKSEMDDTTFFSDLASVLLEKDEAGAGRIRRIIQVPADDDPEAKNPIIPRIEYTILNGFITVIVHDIRNLTKEDIQNGYVFLHGATHIPQVEILSGRIFVNPGHFSLMEKDKPTYGLIDISDSEIIAEIRDLSHSVLMREKIKVKRARKFGTR